MFIYIHGKTQAASSKVNNLESWYFEICKIATKLRQLLQPIISISSLHSWHFNVIPYTSFHDNKKPQEEEQEPAQERWRTLAQKNSTIITCIWWGLINWIHTYMQKVVFDPKAKLNICLTGTCNLPTYRDNPVNERIPTLPLGVLKSRLHNFTISTPNTPPLKCFTLIDPVY